MAKISRNAPCPCGSGKKYKQCCLGKAAPPATPSATAEHRRAPAAPPTRPSPQPLQDLSISAYTIGKLFEDSEQFAKMQRLQPEKAALFWTPRKVAALSTKEILAKLRTLTVDVSRDAYLALAANQTSAWAISEYWYRTITKPLSCHDDDFLGLAACELWKRYCPKRPSIEMLDDQMQAGYGFLQTGQITRACDEWWKVWQVIGARLHPEMRTTWQATVAFNGTQYLHDWVQDFAIELHNAALKDRRYAQIGVHLCEAVLAHFPDEGELFVTNFRADLGEFQFLTGDPVTGEQVLLDLIRDWPNRAAGYVRLADLLGHGPLPQRQPIDPERAVALLEQALARPVIDAADYDLARRLAELREQLAGYTPHT